MARKKGDPTSWQYGRLVNPTKEALEHEARSRHLYGSDIIDRVQAGIEPPGVVETRPSDVANLAIVGQSQRDFHALERITGRAKYASDVYPTKVLQARTLRSPYPHARVKSIDISKAEKVEGVRAIITFKDVKNPADRNVLTDEPTYAGEGIAAVAGDDLGVVEEALRLIEVEYEQLPFVIDAREALKPGAPLVRSTLKTNAVRDPQFSYKRGDAAKGFAEAEVIVENKTNTQWEQHAAMEPHIAVAQWERGGDRLTVWTSSQYIHSMRDGIARVLGMQQSKVRVICEYMGGGWGDKTGWFPYHIIAAMLAQKTGQPVRHELSRKDVFLEAGHNYPKYQELRLGFKRDGTLVAGASKSWIASGAWGARANTDDVESALRLYKCDNWDVEGYAASTNTFVAGPLRSVGEPSGVFALETLMDMAAEKLNMDPVELRLKNIEERRDQVANLPYSSNGVREAIVKAAEAFDWKNKWKGWNKQRDLTKPQRGVGFMAFACAKGAKSAPMTAQVHVERDGSVKLVAGAAELGGSQRTSWAMIVAETLGVPLATVTTSTPDTDYTTDTGVIAGSRGTKSVGSAALAAAQDAKDKLLANAAGRLQRPASDLDIKDGVIVSKTDASVKLTIADAVASGTVVIDQTVFNVATTIIGIASLPPPAGWSQKTFGAGFYEIEVDPGTGRVNVLTAVQAHDIGKAINPVAVENQIHGGIFHGMNKALTEEIIFDPATGVPVNTNFDEYKLHMINKMPKTIKVIQVEPIDTIGPYGAKGIGEPANLPPMPAIANAIYDAIGVRMTQTPMTPYRVVKAVRSL